MNDVYHWRRLDQCIKMELVAERPQAERPTTAIMDKIVFGAPKLFAILVLPAHEHAIKCYSLGESVDDNFPALDQSPIPDVDNPGHEQEL